MKNERSEYILCAAIHFDDGKEYVHMPVNVKTGFVIAGRRHHNCYAQFAAMKFLNGTTEASFKDFPEHTQGFITSKDNFVNRKEAFVIAKRENQIIHDLHGREEGGLNILVSEDLYSENIY